MSVAAASHGWCLQRSQRDVAQLAIRRRHPASGHRKRGATPPTPAREHLDVIATKETGAVRDSKYDGEKVACTSRLYLAVGERVQECERDTGDMANSRLPAQGAGETDLFIRLEASPAQDDLRRGRTRPEGSLETQGCRGSAHLLGAEHLPPNRMGSVRHSRVARRAADSTTDDDEHAHHQTADGEHCSYVPPNPAQSLAGRSAVPFPAELRETRRTDAPSHDRAQTGSAEGLTATITAILGRLPWMSDTRAALDRHMPARPLNQAGRKPPIGHYSPSEAQAETCRGSTTARSALFTSCWSSIVITDGSASSCGKARAATSTTAAYPRPVLADTPGGEPLPLVSRSAARGATATTG